MTAPAWICATCGTQFESAIVPPTECPVCADERQYVGWEGQRWTHMEELSGQRHIRFDREDGLTTMSISHAFGIGQRAFLLPDGDRHVMWECLSLVTAAAVDQIKAAGGVSCVAISHPHFYTAMVDWAEALGDVPVYVHDADRGWVQRHSPLLRFWTGERLELSQNMTLVRLPGHFDGSAGLWWRTGSRAGGSLFPGDALQVTMDRRHVSFMFSYPNAIPLSPAAVRGLRDRVAPLGFEDVFGFSAGRQIISDAKAAVDKSFARYLRAVAEAA